MVCFSLEKTFFLVTVIVAGILAGSLPESVVGQTCGCASGFCCSKYGYCGNTDAHCCFGCKEGACRKSSVVVAEVVTVPFFNSITEKANAECEGKKFYTRQAFLEAAKSYPEFGTTCSDVISKREIAAFFAHVTHETGSFCHINEINGESTDPTKYCDDKNHPTYPCDPKKKYYGRGPLQLSYNYNYGAAGDAIRFDGLKEPERVASDAVTSFKAALWFWKENVQQLLGEGKAFGDTIHAINSIECNGGNPDAVRNRIAYYKDYCNRFGVDPGNNLDCGSTIALSQSI